MTYNYQPKNFWKRPEGVTGAIGLSAIVFGGGYLLYKSLPYLISFTSNFLALAGMMLVLGAIIYMILDPKMRTLIWYFYKSIMRWIILCRRPER
jgi:hypothetical protein